MASSSYERKLPPRNGIKRVLPDMISHADFDLMVKSKKAVKKSNITGLSVSSTTNSAPDCGVDRSSWDLKNLKRKKVAGKKADNKYSFVGFFYQRFCLGWR